MRFGPLYNEYTVHNYLDFKEVGESGEITIPIKPRPKNFYLKYLITVPKGYVKLTLHGE